MSKAIALLWANYIINGKKTDKEVPEGLKASVAEELVARNREDLLTS